MRFFECCRKKKYTAPVRVVHVRAQAAVVIAAPAAILVVPSLASTQLGLGVANASQVAPLTISLADNENVPGLVNMGALSPLVSLDAQSSPSISIILTPPRESKQEPRWLTSPPSSGMRTPPSASASGAPEDKTPKTTPKGGGGARNKLNQFNSKDEYFSGRAKTEQENRENSSVSARR